MDRRPLGIEILSVLADDTDSAPPPSAPTEPKAASFRGVTPGILDGLLAPALIILLVVVLGALGYALLWSLKDVGIFAEAYRLLVTLPPSYAKTMNILTVLLILAASVLTPLAILETRAKRAFERLEAQLRAEFPDAVFAPFEGAEGKGVSVEGPSGPVLLLHPVAGVGAPRVVRPEVRPQGDSYVPDAQS